MKYLCIKHFGDKKPRNPLRENGRVFDVEKFKPSAGVASWGEWHKVTYHGEFVCNIHTSELDGNMMRLPDEDTEKHAFKHALTLGMVVKI